MSINIDMSGIEEKAPLAEGQYTLSFTKVEFGRNKADDGDQIYTQVAVEGLNEVFNQYWSFKPGALSSNSSGISIKKFLEVVGRPDLANLHITDENIGDLIQAMRQMRFTGFVKHEQWQGNTRLKIGTVYEAV